MSSIFFFLFFFFLLLFKIRAVLFFFSPFLFTIRALFVLKCPKVPRITRELPQSAPACAPSPKAPSLHARSPRGWGASAAWASRALITIRSGYGASRWGGGLLGGKSKLLVRAQDSQSQRHHPAPAAAAAAVAAVAQRWIGRRHVGCSGGAHCVRRSGVLSCGCGAGSPIESSVGSAKQSGAGDDVEGRISEA